ncbi:hypothetical protein [Paenibacillus sp. FSL R7-0331]|uniref:hypothetical protein n=1 Tax=Paenibacillus sp. FSL R7-0331 TaxID=1536773 RepID=UPI0006947418|nr:hypothetical protein [Paenibacillus sp. FSL R7-0331]
MVKVKTKGFRALKGKSDFSHRFGGERWKTPVCPNCKTHIHLLLTFDLLDENLSELSNEKSMELPLISCLNCSSYWSPQQFKLNVVEHNVSIITMEDEEHWIAEEEDIVVYPLPEVAMKLIELQKKDNPDPNDDHAMDLAFNAFGSEYICRVLDNPLIPLESTETNCPSCASEMRYVATICSEDYGSEGLIYEELVFRLGEAYLNFYFCKECLIVRTSMQST